MCGHASGIMGFPLRLLAREVYDRVVQIKGPKEVALITGEERIAPNGARWLICTTESMPTDRETAFVALDEAQLGTDPERGHVFTDRLLHARGREETMILGSDSISGLVRKLVPEAEITRRPRFSTLSYAGREEAVAPAQALGDRRVQRRGSLRRRRNAAAGAGRGGSGDGCAQPPHAQRASRDVPGGRSRLPRRHRRDRHGPQHGRGARRIRRADQIRRHAATAADGCRNGADRRTCRAASTRRDVRVAGRRRGGQCLPARRGRGDRSAPHAARRDAVLAQQRPGLRQCRGSGRQPRDRARPARVARRTRSGRSGGAQAAGRGRSGA